MASSVDTYNKVLDEFNFSKPDKHGFRTLQSELSVGWSCHASFMNGKICLEGVGKGGGFKTGDLSMSEMQTRQLLTIITSNHI
jgi:hypothetical protein